jgi:arylsulfatase A-like enzyme/Tfp pilus assembly protein PilF
MGPYAISHQPSAMSRYAAALFGLIACGCGRAAPQADLHTVRNQNVLLITIDTLRADALGCYGGRASTPALDRLASQGVRFDFAHAQAVVTLPSHATILTGEYPFTHGLRDNSGYRLPDGARTVATMLKAAGYETAAFVAAFPLHSRFGLNRGFDVYDDHFGESHMPEEFAMPERPASSVAPLARSWIAARGSSSDGQRPWFVWLHLFDPHAPYVPSYEGEVAKVDAALAPLLDQLRSAPTPTLVIVTGDHGESLGEHGEQSHGLFAYEATLRVPLIIAELRGSQSPSPQVPSPQVPSPQVPSPQSPSPQSPREVSSIPARHIDLLPTILEAIGQAVPADLPGRSLLGASERVAGAAPRPSYFEAMSGVLNRGTAPLSGVIVDRDKFIDLPVAERYDLGADAGERVNLAGRAAERDRTLMGVLRGYNAVLPGGRVVESREAAERLRALGYASASAAPKSKYMDADDPKQIVALDAAMHRAVEAFGAGKAADAIQLYREIIASRPDFAVAYRHMAFIEAQRGNLPAAVAILQRAINVGIRPPAIVAQLAGYLVDAGRVAQAIQLLEPLAADPDADADTLNTLGIALATAGRRADAQRVFERVLTINPSSSVPLENLGMLALESGDVANASKRFEAAIATDPKSSRGYSGVGLVALRAGDRRAAIDAWTRAVELDAANFDALYNLGTTLVRDGQRERAQRYLEQFVKTAPPAYDRDKREVEKLIEHR